MSLNMYIGEVQAQTESMNAFCNATIQGMEEVIRSIDAFALDVTLKGKTYESAKTFFMQTYRQLAQGIIYLCEELIIQNNAFPADFQAEVATVDVVEQEIREQIRELEQMIAAIAAMDEQTPETAAMLQIYHAMKRKLEDKLERLYQFNYSSSENYRTAIELASSIAKGLAEVQSGKGFQAVSGTFHTERLNMEWAKPIQVITEEKMRKAEEERIKDESLLDKFKDAVEDGVGALDQASEKFFHTLENTPILGQLYSFKKGMDEAAIDGLKGLVNTFLHPIDSFESAMYALSHPQETFNSVT
nr:T7SS effector LXG polymorphic toxin [Bacillus manliponensis]